MGTKPVTWVTMGPEPHLATCQRCGGTVPKPALPIDTQDFLRYLDVAISAHANCRERTRSEKHAE